MSQATYYRLTPLDTALFRDARPFSAEDSGGARLGFWTPPQLGVLGAFRNLLLEEARCNYEEFKNGGGPATTGAGPNQPGTLCLGPVLWGVQSHNASRLVFPPPADLVRWQRGRDESGTGFHLPAVEKRITNLPSGLMPLEPARWTTGGRLRRVTSSGDERITPQERSLPQDSLPAYLLGEPVKELLSVKDYFASETRIGIERSTLTHTANEGMLYTAEMLRPHTRLPAVSSFYAISVHVGGENLPANRRVIALGGERRPFELCQDTSLQPVPPTLRSRVSEQLVRRAENGNVEFRLYLASPVAPGPDRLQGWRPFLPKIPHVDLTVLAAAVPRCVWMSGWNIREPLDGRPYIPAGAVYFLKASSTTLEANDMVEKLMETFWDRPSLCDPGRTGVNDLLQARAGYGVTLVGVTPNAG